jgi:hypothetical protein
VEEWETAFSLQIPDKSRSELLVPFSIVRLYPSTCIYTCILHDSILLFSVSTKRMPRGGSAMVNTNRMRARLCHYLARLFYHTRTVQVYVLLQYVVPGTVLYVLTNARWQKRVGYDYLYATRTTYHDVQYHHHSRKRGITVRPQRPGESSLFVSLK